MERSNQQTVEPREVIEKKTVVAPKPARMINFYAALAIGLIVSVISAAFFTLAAYLVTQVSYNYQEVLGMMTVLTTAVLFVGLPLLLGSKHRWKTVLATYILQSIFLFFIVFMIIAIFGGQNSSSPPGYETPYGNDTLKLGM